MQKLKKRFSKSKRSGTKAMIKGDIATLDRIFADDYFWVSVNGTKK
jgi:hypothetical protein